MTSSRALATIAIVGNLPALAFLAYSVAYMLGYTATFAYVVVGVLASAVIALAVALVVFAFQQMSGPLIALDAVFIALCVVSLPLLLILDPRRPVGADVLVIPIALGGPAALGATAAIYHRRLWRMDRR